MDNNKNLNLMWFVLIFALAQWFWACTQNPADPALENPKTLEAHMDSSRSRLSEPAAIPPIDAAAPEIFQTATFGLG